MDWPWHHDDEATAQAIGWERFLGGNEALE
jgi:hypothetical protein